MNAKNKTSIHHLKWVILWAIAQHVERRLDGWKARSDVDIAMESFAQTADIQLLELTDVQRVVLLVQDDQISTDRQDCKFECLHSLIPSSKDVDLYMLTILSSDLLTLEFRDYTI